MRKSVTMTRQQLLDKLNRATSLRIHGGLVLDQFTRPMEGIEFLKDLPQGFIDDIQYITGTVNGLEVTDTAIRFVVKAVENTYYYPPVISFVLNFANDKQPLRYRGKCLGISDILYKKDLNSPEPSENAFRFEIKEAPEQIRQSIRGFIARAVERGYLVVE